LSLIYRNNYKYKQSAQTYEEIFELIKDFNEFGAISVMKEAYDDYECCGLSEESNNCKNKLFEYFVSINLNEIFYEKIWDLLSKKN